MARNPQTAGLEKEPRTETVYTVWRTIATPVPVPRAVRYQRSDRRRAGSLVSRQGCRTGWR